MDAIDEAEYLCLQFFTAYTREAYEKDKTMYKMDYDEIRRLHKLGYLDFEKSSKKLHHPYYVMTEKGYERYQSLKKKDLNEYAIWIVAISLLISLVSLLKSFNVF